MKTVLVIEDEAIIAMELEAHLHEFGYQVVGPVSTYAEALREAERTPPDLVLADIRISGGRSGLEAAAQIRARHGSALVVLTAHADTASRDEARAHGVDAILDKPFRRSTLEQTLTELVAP
jgi:CheY-like chemotaxis protein